MDDLTSTLDEECALRYISWDITDIIFSLASRMDSIITRALVACLLVLWFQAAVLPQPSI